MTTYDLTRRVSAGMPGYPDDPPVELDTYADVPSDGYRATALRLTTHTGTHVDAPAHTEADGRTIDTYPPEALRFDAVRLDVPVAGPRDPIGRGGLRDAADAAGLAAADADMVVLDTGWADHWGEDGYADHPYLTPDAAAWLAAGGYAVGVDALSVDPTPTASAAPGDPSGLRAHHALLGAGLLVVENLTNLAALPGRFRLVASPLPVADGDGAPARVVAEG